MGGEGRHEAGQQGDDLTHTGRPGGGRLDAAESSESAVTGASEVAAASGARGPATPAMMRAAVQDLSLIHN